MSYAVFYGLYHAPGPAQLARAVASRVLTRPHPCLVALYAAAGLRAAGISALPAGVEGLLAPLVRIPFFL